MDEASYSALTKLRFPELLPISLVEFEAKNPELLGVKAERSIVEYYFTCTPSLPLYVFGRAAEVDEVTYVDADVKLFASPDPLFSELGDGSVSIVGHRFPQDLKHMERAGIFNVGWLTFKRDRRALECLEWWRERCLEWCFDRFEDGKFADQKYLDTWPQRFQGVVELKHKGANLAPWNLRNYSIEWKDDSVRVDDQSLIFFHYHGLKRLKGPLFDLNLAAYRVNPNRVVRNRIYKPYLKNLIRTGNHIGRLLPVSEALASNRSDGLATSASIIRRLGRVLRFIRNLVLRRYAIVIKKSA